MKFSAWRLIWFMLLPPLLVGGCKIPLDERQAVAELQKKVAMLEEELESGSTRQQGLQQKLEDLQIRFDEVRDLLLKQGEELKVLSRSQAAMTQRLAEKTGSTGERAAVTESRPSLSAFSKEEEEVFEQVYKDSLTAYQNGDYENAVKLFASYLRDFPATAKAANARYWLGESYYSLAQYAQAITEFKRVQNDFPASAKDSAALLKIAMSYDAIGSREPAREAYTEFLRKYPDGSNAQLAEKALARLE